MALATSVVAKMVDILPVTPMMSTVAAVSTRSHSQMPFIPARSVGCAFAGGREPVEEAAKHREYPVYITEERQVMLVDADTRDCAALHRHGLRSLWAERRANHSMWRSASGRRSVFLVRVVLI